LTRRTLVLIAVGVALMLVAATIKSGWLYLVSSVLFSLVILGLVSGWAAGRALEVTRRSERETFEGESFLVRLRVRNTGRLARYLLTVRDSAFSGESKEGLLGRLHRKRAEYREFIRTGEVPEGLGSGAGKSKGNSCSIVIERIRPGEELEVEYEMRAPRRGVYENAGIAVVSGGIFGSAEVSRRLKVRSPLTVFPRVSELEYFPFQPSSAAPQEAFEWSRKGMGQDYYGVREYVRGDSLRRIHWKSSARQGQLIVKEYQQEFRPSSGLVILLSEPYHGDVDENSLEDGLRCAASILNYYTAMGGRPLLVMPRGESVEIMEDGTLYENLAALAAYRAYPAVDGSDGTWLREALTSAASALVGGSALCLVTNAPAESVAAALDSAVSMSGFSVVVAVDESYGRGWDTGVALLEVGKLESAVSGRANLFVMTDGREIGRCLSEPLSTIAS
jgi:uncharacterized protein (DUF58 family)